jgi:hypothetical protein
MLPCLGLLSQLHPATWVALILVVDLGLYLACAGDSTLPDRPDPIDLDIIVALPCKLESVEAFLSAWHSLLVLYHVVFVQYEGGSDPSSCDSAAAIDELTLLPSYEFYSASSSLAGTMSRIAVEPTWNAVLSALAAPTIRTPEMAMAMGLLVSDAAFVYVVHGHSPHSRFNHSQTRDNLNQLMESPLINVHVAFTHRGLPKSCQSHGVSAAEFRGALSTHGSILLNRYSAGPLLLASLLIANDADTTPSEERILSLSIGQVFAVLNMTMTAAVGAHDPDVDAALPTCSGAVGAAQHDNLDTTFFDVQILKENAQILEAFMTSPEWTERNTTNNTTESVAVRLLLVLFDKRAFKGDDGCMMTDTQQISRKVTLSVRLWQMRFGRLSSCHEMIDFTGRHSQCAPKWQPVATRSSLQPSSSSATCAVSTMVYNEKVFLPIWARYYSRHVDPRDIYILDHYTDDGSTHPESLPLGIRVIRTEGDRSFAPHYFINRRVERHTWRLLRAGYRCVLFGDADEIHVPDPSAYPDGLRQFLDTFAADASRTTIRLRGVQVAHASWGDYAESGIDWSWPILQQRKYWVFDDFFDKPVLSKVPMRWGPGFHHGASAERECKSSSAHC